MKGDLLQNWRTAIGLNRCGSMGLFFSQPIATIWQIVVCVCVCVCGLRPYTTSACTILIYCLVLRSHMAQLRAHDTVISHQANIQHVAFCVACPCTAPFMRTNFSLKASRCCFSQSCLVQNKIWGRLY